jgi:hypothetical protein
MRELGVRRLEADGMVIEMGDPPPPPLPALPPDIVADPDEPPDQLERLAGDWDKHHA